jgi:TonB family protein
MTFSTNPEPSFYVNEVPAYRYASGRRGLLRALSISALLHAGLVVIFTQWGPASGAWVSAGQASVVRKVVRTAVQVDLPSRVAMTQVQPVSSDAPSPPPPPERAASVDVRASSEEHVPKEPQASSAVSVPAPSNTSNGGEVYYPSELLSVAPQAMGVADFDPPSIRHIVASGHVIVKVWVNHEGKTTHTRIVSATILPAFADAAAKAFEKLAFIPGNINGMAVGAVMTIDVHYEDGRLINFGVVE